MKRKYPDIKNNNNDYILTYIAYERFPVLRGNCRINLFIILWLWDRIMNTNIVYEQYIRYAYIEVPRKDSSPSPTIDPNLTVSTAQLYMLYKRRICICVCVCVCGQTQFRWISIKIPVKPSSQRQYFPINIRWWGSFCTVYIYILWVRVRVCVFLRPL